MVAIGFRPGEQFPRFTLYPPHFVEQAFAEALFVLGLSINDSVYECATNSCSQLSRFDLGVGAVVAAIVARQMQDRHDTTEYNALQKRHDQLRAMTKQNEEPTDTASKPSNPGKVTVTISPLRNGLTRTLLIGGSLDDCTAGPDWALRRFGVGCSTWVESR